MINDIAFILHKRAYKESSELIKLLTKNYGIVDAIAKGCRKPKSSLNGQLQPFLLTEITFTGRSDLKTLTHASQQGSLKKCAYKNHVSMLYCNELLTLVQFDHDTCKALFEAYQFTVSALQDRESVSLLLRRFEWLLSCELGYELNLPENIKKTDFLSFDPLLGLQVNNLEKVCTVATLEKFLLNKAMNNHEIKQINVLMKSLVNHLVHGKTIQSRTLLMN